MSTSQDWSRAMDKFMRGDLNPLCRGCMSRKNFAEHSESGYRCPNGCWQRDDGTWVLPHRQGHGHAIESAWKEGYRCGVGFDDEQWKIYKDVVDAEWNISETKRERRNHPDE